MCGQVCGRVQCLHSGVVCEQIAAHPSYCARARHGHGVSAVRGAQGNRRAQRRAGAACGDGASASLPARAGEGARQSAACKHARAREPQAGRAVGQPCSLVPLDGRAFDPHKRQGDLGVPLLGRLEDEVVQRLAAAEGRGVGVSAMAEAEAEAGGGSHLGVLAVVGVGLCATRADGR